jgi:hypothetical protein
MKTVSALLVAMTLQLATASDPEWNGQIDEGQDIPPNATFICGGHVTGLGKSDGIPGQHITWRAFGSSQESAQVVLFYSTQFGRGPAMDNDGSHTWKFNEGASAKIYSVYSSYANGPWSECVARSQGLQSVILISSMTSFKR